MDGILLVDKPSGWTSFDIVNKVRHIVEASDQHRGAKKRFPVGHAGTLDPLATGLLILMLGGYTKQAPLLIKHDKTYEVSMRLGETSTTGDNQGEKVAVSTREPPLKEVQEGLQKFVGQVQQTPPIYSAIKVNGQRAYKLARAGRLPQLESRAVTIYQINLVDYAYPYVRFIARVSSGTYIRSLVEDVGTLLGTGAYTSDLRRTQVGAFTVDQALSVDILSSTVIHERLLKPT